MRGEKFFIESTRLRKWRTSGVLWWNVLDGWPQFSDAVVDYYFAPKLAYHYIRRVQQPVCVIIGEQGPDKYLPVVVANDSLQATEVSYRIWDADSQETVAQGQFTAPANENWQVARIRTYAGDQRLYLIQWTVGGRLGNHYPPASRRPPRALLPVAGGHCLSAAPVRWRQWPGRLGSEGTG